MIDQDFSFHDLFILDLANNHQGSVEHGLRIVQSMAEVVNRRQVRAAIKFQFRQLDTFIHPSHQANSELKYIQRFQSTRLDQAQFQTLLNEVWAQGLLAMCTPFDEESVNIAVDMGFNVLKVASCSAKDWPLLEEIAGAGPPVVCSTGGLTLEDIDNVVSFFQHRAVQFALMHCVSVYPTPDPLLTLNQIQVLRNRYPNIPIGWSTHENPGDTVPVQIAVALGARLFERHIGLETESIKLNAYSSTSQQVDTWLEAYNRAKVLCGPKIRPPASEVEKASLDGLRRGIYAKRLIKKGRELTRDLVYFAMPYVEGQMESGTWKEGYTAIQDMASDQPVMRDAVEITVNQGLVTLKQAIHEVKALLNEANIQLGSEFKVEYSHHYGLENFRQTGAVLIECINREYCKKLVIQLPGQRHPSHYHARKEETFQILYGILNVNIDGYPRILHPGETILILPGVWHSFWTDTGVVFEEVSTTHYQIMIITDQEAIYQSVQNFGGEVCLVREACRTGTDRVAKVVSQLKHDIIVNLQADEIPQHPGLLDDLILPFTRSRAGIGTLKRKLNKTQDLANPSIVKVVTDHQGHALYFSRSPIPCWRDGVSPGNNFVAFMHLGIYIFRKAELVRFAGLPTGYLEDAEKLEQLRALEHGLPIMVWETAHESIRIDNPEDVLTAEALLTRSSCEPKNRSLEATQRVENR